MCITYLDPKVDRCEFWGEKLVIPVTTMNMRTQALIDTGSGTSIAPLSLFNKAINNKEDIDAFVERVPGKTDIIIRDAPGNKMEILDSIRLGVEILGKKVKVALYVSKALDDVIILGTNILRQLGLRVSNEDGSIDYPARKTTDTQKHYCHAKVTQRAYMPQRGVKVPAAIDDTQLEATTKRRSVKVKEGESRRPFKLTNEVFCRSTMHVVDNSALSIFYACSGTRRYDDDDGFECSIRGKVFGDVVKTAEESILSLPITTIYSLARYISIYESEKDSDRRCFLIRDRKHSFITTAGVQKACLLQAALSPHNERSHAS